MNHDPEKQKRTIKWFINGIVGLFKAVTAIDATRPEEVVYRIITCTHCEKLNIRRCSLCGCIITHKSLLESEHCPINKW